jgi:development and cell death domain-containing protein
LQEISPTKCHIFACTAKSQQECFDRMLFSTNKVYEDKALAVKKGDRLLLLNVDSDILYGMFRAKSDGKKNIVPEAWGGKYPYQIEVEKTGEITAIEKAGKVLSRLNINWKKTIDERKSKLLLTFIEATGIFLSLLWDGIKKVTDC